MTIAPSPHPQRKLLDYFKPGLREIARTATRIYQHVCLRRLRSGLVKVETELGVLGWQQADFDEETQRQVDAIHDVERAQASLVNQSAEIARSLEALAEERKKVLGEFDSRRAELDGAFAAARKPLAEAERRLRDLNERESEVSRKIEELNDEEKEVGVLCEKLLLVHPQPPNAQRELLAFRDRTIALTNERRDLRTEHGRILSQTDETEKQHAAATTKCDELKEQIRELDAAVKAETERLDERHEELKQEKERVAREENQLDRAKIDPYREIGRVLADSRIAPMNQPAALSHVLEVRKKIAATEKRIVELTRESAAQNQTELLISLALLTVIVVALSLILAALF